MVDEEKFADKFKWVPISDEEFKLLSNYVYDKIGINLTEQKKLLLMGRLQRLLREKNFKTFKEYYKYITSDSSGIGLSELANYISTNYTYFYREAEHFNFFVDIALPESLEYLRETSSNELRIWSAGCSSGEEPYTLVMLMMEKLGSLYNNYNISVLATDISERVLDVARKGVYKGDRLRNLPENFVKKYFKRFPNDYYQVVEVVRKAVRYKQFNLVEEFFPFNKQFNIIFCRNVMIYFDEPFKKSLTQKFYELTVPGGYLFIGTSERLRDPGNLYNYVGAGVYKRM